MLVPFGHALGLSLTAGVNLYATIAILGLAARYDWVAVPAQYDVFASDWVIALALLLYAVEFVADKIPWFDSLWDGMHTFIRPIGGALIAVVALGSPSPGLDVLSALAGGAIAASGHLAKASTRVAVNASPEPVSNWILSIAEDGFVVALAVFALTHPMAALIVTLLLLVVIAVTLRWMLRRLRRLARPAATP